MSFREFKIAEQVVPPRPREELLEYIESFLENYPIGVQQRKRLMAYIAELEEGAWQGGASEGYDHGYQEAEHKLTQGE